MTLQKSNYILFDYIKNLLKKERGSPYITNLFIVYRRATQRVG